MIPASGAGARQSIRDASPASAACRCRSLPRSRRPGRPWESSEFENRRQLIRTRVADDGAVELREAGPIDRGARLACVFVPAHERQRVAAAWIRDRDAGIARYADARRNARARPRSARPARGETALPCRLDRRRTGRPTSAARLSCPRAPFPRAGSRSLPVPAVAGPRPPTSIFSASGRAWRSRRG